MRSRTPVVVLLGLMFTTVYADTTTLNVSVSTEPIQGQAGFVALDFIDGDGLFNSSVSITDFSTDASLGPLSLSGDSSGSLVSPPLELGDGAFFNEGLQQVVFGTSLSFRVRIDSMEPFPPFPDAFSLFVLGDTRAPYETTDTTGADALLVAELGAVPKIQTFESQFATVTLAGGYEIDSVVADPDVLWPPNDKMVPVSLTVEPVSGEIPDGACEIASVGSDEPPVDDDYELTGPLSLDLRATREGEGDGRVYSVEVSCEGAAGDGTAVAEVRVPHDQGN